MSPAFSPRCPGGARQRALGAPTTSVEELVDRDVGRRKGEGGAISAIAAR